MLCGFWELDFIASYLETPTVTTESVYVAAVQCFVLG